MKKNNPSLLYYHNPRCSKSRQGLSLLQEKGLEFEVKEYLQDPLTVSELSDLFQKLDIKPQDVIRRKEAVFKGLNLSGKNLSPQEWAEVIVKNPILLERPILVKGNKAVMGRPPEKLLELI